MSGNALVIALSPTGDFHTFFCSHIYPHSAVMPQRQIFEIMLHSVPLTRNDTSTNGSIGCQHNANLTHGRSGSGLQCHGGWQSKRNNNNREAPAPQYYRFRAPLMMSLAHSSSKQNICYNKWNEWLCISSSSKVTQLKIHKQLHTDWYITSVLFFELLWLCLTTHKYCEKVWYWRLIVSHFNERETATKVSWVFKWSFSLVQEATPSWRRLMVQKTITDTKGRKVAKETAAVRVLYPRISKEMWWKKHEQQEQPHPRTWRGVTKSGLQLESELHKAPSIGSRTWIQDPGPDSASLMVWSFKPKDIITSLMKQVLFCVVLYVANMVISPPVCECGIRHSWVIMNK